jgi:hypothetical protein
VLLSGALRPVAITCSCLISSVLCAKSVVAEAPLGSLALTWQAPHDCPDETSVRRSLDRLLSAGESTSRHLMAEARVEPSSDSAWTLTLRTELDGVVGERILHGRSCDTVTDAAVLTMALMLNPDMPLDHDAPTQSLPNAGVSPKLPNRAVERPAIAPIHPAKAFGLQLGTELGFAVGVLPRAGPVIGLGLGATLGDASLWLNANYDPPQTQSLADYPDIGGRLWSACLGMLGCWTLRGRVVGIGTCVGGEVTRLDGVGVHVSHPQHGVVYWSSAAAAAHFDVRLHSRFSLRLLGTGLVPLDRPSVYLDDLGWVHRPWRVAGRVQAGVVVDLL